MSSRRCCASSEIQTQHRSLPRLAPRPLPCFPVEKKAPGGQLGEVGSSGAFPDTEGTTMNTLTTTPDLLFTTWNDPAVTTGIAADSDDALVWLTPILGPTATLVLHRLARYLTAAPECAFTPSELAATFGLANTDGTPSPGFTRALHRLQMFGMARTIGSHTEIRLIIPPLSQRHVGRIPAYLRTAYPWPTT